MDRAAKPAFRRDIQGLRAIAVLLVVLDHAGVPFLQGGYVGVDVFFVLSGFLITGLLLAGPRSGPRLVLDFYVRRARRILPAATLTLVVTIVASYLLLNVVRARQAVVDSIWASLFMANVHYANEGTDYFARGQPPSPVQHYWSLSVEEQFYFAWPALVALALFGIPYAAHRLRGRRHGRPAGVDRTARLALLALTLVVAGASFAWSVFLTDRQPTDAYFSTVTRAWELALGALLAIAGASLVRLPRLARSVMGWLGLAAIVVAAVAYTSSTPFPGDAALLPTLGAALVIAAGVGRDDDPPAPAACSARAPLRYVGDRSYAFYLWHWPVLVIAGLYVGEELSVMTNLLLVVFAFGISIVSYALVEDPIRRARWSASGELGARPGVRRRGRGRRGGRARLDRREGAAHDRGRPSGARARDPGAARRLHGGRERNRSPRWSRRSTPPGAGRRFPRASSPHPIDSSPARTSTTSRPDARRRPTSRRRATSAGSATRRAPSRSSSSGTPMPRCGCRRSSPWRRRTAGR